MKDMELSNFNGTNRSTEGPLRMCNEFVVTYYWNEVAEGAHLITNLILVPTLIILGMIGSVLNSLLIIAYAKNSRLRTLPSMMFHNSCL